MWPWWELLENRTDRRPLAFRTLVLVLCNFRLVGLVEIHTHQHVQAPCRRSQGHDKKALLVSDNWVSSSFSSSACAVCKTVWVVRKMVWVGSASALVCEQVSSPGLDVIHLRVRPYDPASPP